MVETNTNDLREACRAVYNDKAFMARFPNGIDSAGILDEIRVRLGPDAFPLCSILDVHDEMTAITQGF